jgi:diacylglycerol kinase family enzyme
LLNPYAGEGQAQRRWAVAKTLFDECLCEVEVVVTARPYHATEIVKNANPGYYDAFITISGDGTIHESINGAL